MFTLDRTSTHMQELATSRMQVPFFVKSSVDFDQKYPLSSAYRQAHPQVDRPAVRCEFLPLRTPVAHSWWASAKLMTGLAGSNLTEKWRQPTKSGSAGYATTSVLLSIIR